MALTMARLRDLAGVGAREPYRDSIQLGVTGINGKYAFLILLELEGDFLQFRTRVYHSCPLGHPNLDATLKVLAELNHRLRFIKFGGIRATVRSWPMGTRGWTTGTSPRSNSVG
jgi:hypothetical protein